MVKVMFIYIAALATFLMQTVLGDLEPRLSTIIFMTSPSIVSYIMYRVATDKEILPWGW